MESIHQTQEKDFKIILTQKKHAPYIAQFQIITAKQTQNLDLIPDLILQAVSYFSQHNQLGFYLIKLNQKDIPIASLLITFQNQSSWWIHSVFVQKQYRRKGHFKSLYQKTKQMAKQKSVKRLKLYHESHNIKAKQTYTNLGFHSTGEMYYTFDFVYGKTKIQQFCSQSKKSPLVVKVLNNQQQAQFLNNQQLRSSFKQILNLKNCQFQENKNKKIIILDQYTNQKLAIITYFTQFSQWRFGLTYYVDSLCIKSQNGQQKQTELNNLLGHIHNHLCKYFMAISQIKVCALRYIFQEVYLQNQGCLKQSQKIKLNKTSIYNCLQKGQIQGYRVMEIDLRQ